MNLIVQAPIAAKVGGTGSTSAAKVFPLYNNSAVAAILPVPGSGRLEGQQFIVRAGGNLYVHGTSPTINFLLQSGNSLTSGNNTTIATLASAQNLAAGAAYPWALEVRLQGDSTSGIVQVCSASFVCNGVSGTVTGTDLTGINLASQVALTNGLPTTSDEPAIQLVAGIIFGVSEAANYANLNQFILEA